MIRKINRWAALVFLPAALLSGCGDKSGDRDALKKDELDRNLNLALQKDTAPATFKDTAVGVMPAPEANTPPQPAPSPRPSNPPRRNPPAPAKPRPSAPKNPSPAPGPAHTAAASVSAGTTFAISLNEQISTDKNKVGDSFTATVRDPVIASDGSTLIPAGATVRGRVTSVNKSGHVGETGVIKIAFESIGFDGKSYPLNATVLEASPTTKTRQSTGEQAAKVAAGAAAGAIIGKIIGKSTKGAIAGGVAGAAAGTAVAMGTADVDVILAQGSRVLIRVDEPIEVRPAT